MEKITSPKIREVEAMAGWYTLIGWFGFVTLIIMAVLKKWPWAVGAFVVAAVATFVAIRAGHEANDCRTIAQALKDIQVEKIKSLYGGDK